MTATKKPTPQIRGLSGYVLGRLQRGQWWTTSDVASAASVSLSQAGTCLARLVKAGVVEKGDVHTCGLRLWRRVEAPAAAPLIGKGDRVRWTVDYPSQLITTGTVRDVTPSMLGVIDDHGNLRLWAPAHVERLPDADPTPWDPPKPAPRFSVGDRVFVGFWGCEGEIVEVLRHEYRVRLADGSISFRPHDDLDPLPAKPKPVIAWTPSVGDVVSLNGEIGPQMTGRVRSTTSAWGPSFVEVVDGEGDVMQWATACLTLVSAPKPVIAWAHRAGLPVKAGPPTPAETAIMGRGAP